MKLLLLPFSIIYGFIVWIRNFMFDHGILKSKEFDIPIIVVGNLATGGTGKTPHVELLIRLLKDNFRVAVISRGYKRKTKGIIEATEDSTSLEIGDEPKQIKQKFPEVSVIVSANRCQAIQKILDSKIGNNPDVIILDDAYQHRYVKPGLAILTTDYNNLLCFDSILPLGKLREHKNEMYRANFVIVTKVPENLKPIDQRIIIKNLKLFPFQTLLFSKLNYDNPVPLFAFEYENLFNNSSTSLSILLVTGIANPKPLREYFEKYSSDIKEIRFADHHRYSKNDLNKIKSAFDKIQSENKIIITTEKDSVRLVDVPDFEKYELPVFYIPVEAELLGESTAIFEEKIKSYIHKNRRKVTNNNNSIQF